MRVELLWWDGCPTHPETLKDLRTVLREEGLDAEVELVEVESDEQAETGAQDRPVQDAVIERVEVREG